MYIYICICITFFALTLCYTSFFFFLLYIVFIHVIVHVSRPRPARNECSMFPRNTPSPPVTSDVNNPRVVDNPFRSDATQAKSILQVLGRWSRRPDFSRLRQLRHADTTPDSLRILDLQIYSLNWLSYGPRAWPLFNQMPPPPPNKSQNTRAHALLPLDHTNTTQITSFFFFLFLLFF